MDESVGFEPRPVVSRRRSRDAWFAVVIGVTALAAVVWVGISGDRGGLSPRPTVHPAAIAVATQPVAIRAASGAPASRAPSGPSAVSAVRPSTVVGLTVHRLQDLRPEGFGPDTAVAVAGWYVATAITDCPPLDAIYRDGSLPYVRGDVDSAAFCQRTGVLYSAPDGPGLGSPGAGPSAIDASIVVGVIVPSHLELLNALPSEVVVIGQFVEAAGCGTGTRCGLELVVDHIAWTPAA